MNVRTVALVAQVHPFIRFSNVVDHNDVIDASVVQRPNHATANKSGPTGHKISHDNFPPSNFLYPHFVVRCTFDSPFAFSAKDKFITATAADQQPIKHAYQYNCKDLGR